MSILKSEKRFSDTVVEIPEKQATALNNLYS